MLTEKFTNNKYTTLKHYQKVNTPMKTTRIKKQNIANIPEAPICP